jgi:hypothetical protein
MHEDFLRGLSWLAERGWVGPAIGMVLFGLAFWAGRRFLAARPAPAGAGADVALAEAYKGVTRDRRAAPRRTVGRPVEVLIDDGSGAEAANGWVVDRSVGGVGVMADAPVAVGAVLKVRARAALETTPWVEVTVRSCKRDGTQFELGCQFRRTPDWNVLLQFG